jgi:hypothetical protein
LVRALRERTAAGEEAIVNLQLPIDEVLAAPAADNPVARMLADARLPDEPAIIDALEARRVELN